MFVQSLLQNLEMSGIRFGNVASFLLIAVLLCAQQIPAARGALVGAHSSDGILPNDHVVSAMKAETSQSSELVPTVINGMKKPCLVFALGRVKSFNDTSPHQKMDFVCELDAEDRVRNNNNPIIHPSYQW